MLEEKLSKPGRWVFGIVLALLGVYILWATFTESGPAAWLIEAQARLIDGYSLKLTAALLFLPAAFAAYGVGCLYDYLTGQGMFRPRKEVRIVAISPGPAPEEVRKAWVGLVMPLGPGETGPRPAKTAAGEEKVGYVVDSARALTILAAHAPEAALWWKRNAPAYYQPGRSLLFPAESCQEVEAPA